MLLDDEVSVPLVLLDDDVPVSLVLDDSVPLAEDEELAVPLVLLEEEQVVDEELSVSLRLVVEFVSLEVVLFVSLVEFVPLVVDVELFVPLVVDVELFVPLVVDDELLVSLVLDVELFVSVLEDELFVSLVLEEAQGSIDPESHSGGGWYGASVVPPVVVLVLVGAVVGRVDVELEDDVAFGRSEVDACVVEGLMLGVAEDVGRSDVVVEVSVWSDPPPPPNTPPSKQPDSPVARNARPTTIITLNRIAILSISSAKAPVKKAGRTGP